MTLAELRELIRLISVVEAQNVSDAQIDVMINQAIREIAVSRRWKWLEKAANISTIVDGQTIAVPTDFEYAIALVDDDSDTVLEYLSPASFFKLWGNDTGNKGTTAFVWTVYTDTATSLPVIWLHPIPSAIDTNRYKLYYYKSITPLTSDSASPQFHSGFHWLIIEWVKWKLFEREEFWDQSEKSRQYFDKMLDQMEQWYSNRTSQHPFLVGETIRTRAPRDINLMALDLI